MVILVELKQKKSYPELSLSSSVETHVRESSMLHFEECSMITKGRSKQVRKGCGIVVIVNKNEGLEVNEVEGANKDILCARAECKKRK